MTPLAENNLALDAFALSYLEVTALTSGLYVDREVGDVFLNGVYIGTLGPVELSNIPGFVEQSGSYVLIDGLCYHVSNRGVVEKGLGNFHVSYCGVKRGGVTSTNTANGEPNIIVVPTPVVNQGYNQGNRDVQVNSNTHQNENITPGEFAIFSVLSEVALWGSIAIFLLTLADIGSRIVRDNPPK